MTVRKRWARGGALLLALAAVLLLAPWASMRASYADRVYATPAEVPDDTRPVAIVFGAGLSRGGGPSAVLYDRVVTAVELYNAGKVRKLLLTGDNRFENYSEPEAMRLLALELGVPEGDLVLDFAGRRTYDSCYRARAIFGLTRAVLVTQRFHLDRALYLASSMGIDAVGVVADRRDYPTGHAASWYLRETLATAGAVVDITVRRPKPVLGEPIPLE